VSPTEAETLLPGQARLALLLVVSPPPVAAPEAANDYALDVGLPRLLKLCEAHSVRTSVLVDADLADERPDLVAELVQRGHELVAHSDSDAVAPLLEQLRTIEGAVVQGWHARDSTDDEHVDPAELLAAGVAWRLRPARTEFVVQELCGIGVLMEVPLAPDLDDGAMLSHLATDAWLQYLIDSFDTLHDEASVNDPRMLALTLHPETIGRPGRIKALEQFLSYATQQEGVWTATAGALALAGSPAGGEA
jgi:allantoinase